jgi:cyanate lyase
MSCHHPLTRADVTELIVAERIQRGIRWSQVAEELGASKEWSTAACLGQMAFNEDQAQVVVRIFNLPAEASHILQAPPYKGSLPAGVPTDPLIYRLHEIMAGYGRTIKKLVNDEFGDGIMSGIDFRMDLSRESDQAGDRVRIVLSGKFLGRKEF